MKIGIVGAGISGLATARAILSRKPDAELIIFESSQRVGGKVWTEISPEGYICEGGVNGFLNKVPSTLELCTQLGVKPMPADESSNKRYIFSRGELHALPEKPSQFLTSRLLSMRGRLRVVYELAAAGNDQQDETLADFANRRLGREAAERMIDPMASGVFAGDPTKLSLKSCFPRIHEVEQEYGSLIRGLLSLQMQARRKGDKETPGPGPGGILTSFAAGMSRMTDTLAGQLGSRIQTGMAVHNIDRSGERYMLQLEDGSEEEFSHVVLAAPAHAQAHILDRFDPTLSALLEGIPYPPLSVVCLGYEKQRTGQILDGFGFLVPSREKRAVLGTIIDSNVFPGRAPEGSILLRSMIGGARSPENAQMPEDQLINLIRSDLKDILDLDADPDFVRVFRHEKAIPQYVVGHSARLEAKNQYLRNHPGLVLTGNAFKGVSLNDCVVNATHTAISLLPKA